MLHFRTFDLVISLVPLNGLADLYRWNSRHYLKFSNLEENWTLIILNFKRCARGNEIILTVILVLKFIIVSKKNLLEIIFK